MQGRKRNTAISIGRRTLAEDINSIEAVSPRAVDGMTKEANKSGAGGCTAEVQLT